MVPCKHSTRSLRSALSIILKQYNQFIHALIEKHVEFGKTEIALFYLFGMQVVQSFPCFSHWIYSVLLDYLQTLFILSWATRLSETDLKPFFLTHLLFSHSLLH